MPLMANFTYHLLCLCQNRPQIFVSMALVARRVRTGAGGGKTIGVTEVEAPPATWTTQKGTGKRPALEEPRSKKKRGSLQTGGPLNICDNPPDEEGVVIGESHKRRRRLLDSWPDDDAEATPTRARPTCTASLAQETTSSATRSVVTPLPQAGTEPTLPRREATPVLEEPA